MKRKRQEKRGGLKESRDALGAAEKGWESMEVGK